MQSKENPQEEWASIGEIAGTHGIRGDVKVLLHSDIPESLFSLHTAYIGAEHQQVHITAVHSYKPGMLIMHFKEYGDATSAEHVRAWKLMLPVSDLPQLPEHSWYQHDILGMTVRTMTGMLVGTITDIMATGANDVYIVHTSTGRDEYIPAIQDVIRSVDPVAREMRIDPLEGMLDES